MAGSRSYKIGSIFNRMSGLLETGVINMSDKPVWYDVYKHHPPKYNPVFDRQAKDIQIKPILYEEDTLRAKIHKTVTITPVNLNDNYKKSKTKICQDLIKSGKTVDEAIKILKQQSKLSRSKVEKHKDPHKDGLYEEIH